MFKHEAHEIFEEMAEEKRRESVFSNPRGSEKRKTSIEK